MTPPDANKEAHIATSMLEDTLVQLRLFQRLLTAITKRITITFPKSRVLQNFFLLLLSSLI